MASQEGFTAVVQMLLEAHADPNLADKENNATALMMAAQVRSRSTFAANTHARARVSVLLLLLFVYSCFVTNCMHYFIDTHDLFFVDTFLHFNTTHAHTCAV